MTPGDPGEARHEDCRTCDRDVRCGNGGCLPLSPAERQLTNFSFAHGGATYDLYDVMALDNFTALLVLKDGRIAFET